MKNIKLEDVILGDLNEFLTSINNYALLTEDVEIKYEQPDLKNQKKILEVLIPYFKNQNLTFSEFNKFIERDDITSYEQKLILYAFQQLYPEQYFQIIYNSSLNNKENVEEIKLELQKISSSLYDNLSKKITDDEYLKQYILADTISKLIKEITVGQKEQNKLYSDYFFDNIFYKLFPNRSDYKKTSKDFYKSRFEGSETKEKVLNIGDNLSGWVMYIFANNTEDVAELINLTDNVISNYKATSVASTDKYFGEDSSISNVGLKIYLPYSLVKTGLQKKFFDEIKSSIDVYDPVGVINSSKKFTDNIYYRYEFNTSYQDLDENGIPFQNIGSYKSTNYSDYMSGIIQLDLFSEQNELYNYYKTRINSLKILIDFINQEKNKIVWTNMGYSDNNDEKNKLDLISKLNNAFNKNIFITIPTGGFENFGINNFRKFVKDIKNG
jgi:hypothetical protein